MIRKTYKIITALLLIVSILMRSDINALANEYVVSIGGDVKGASRDVDVTYTQTTYNADFSVLIPKSISLGETKRASYNLTVKGSVEPGLSVRVQPRDDNSESAETQIYMKETTGFREKSVLATVSQTETVWTEDEITESGTTKHGAILAEDLSRGEWHGKLHFDISINDANHVHRFVDGVCVCGYSDVPDNLVQLESDYKSTVQDWGAELKYDSLFKLYVNGKAQESTGSYTFTEAGLNTVRVYSDDSRYVEFQVFVCDKPWYADIADKPGVYDSADNLLISWDDMCNVYGLNPSSSTPSSYQLQSVLPEDIIPKINKVVCGSYSWIKANMFYGCDSIEYLYIPDTVFIFGADIGTNTGLVLNNSNLKHLDSAAKIVNFTLGGTTHLTELRLLSGTKHVYRIGRNSTDSVGIDSIYLPDDLECVNMNALQILPTDGTLFIPYSTKYLAYNKAKSSGAYVTGNSSISTVETIIYATDATSDSATWLSLWNNLPSGEGKQETYYGVSRFEYETKYRNKRKI